MLSEAVQAKIEEVRELGAKEGLFVPGQKASDDAIIFFGLNLILERLNQHVAKRAEGSPTHMSI